MPEIRRHNPDDRIEIAVHADSLPNRVRVTAERSPPVTVTEHGSFNESRPLIVGGVNPAHLGPRRQHRKVTRTRHQDLDALRLFTTCKICIGGPYRRDLLKTSDLSRRSHNSGAEAPTSRLFEPRKSSKNRTSCS